MLSNRESARRSRRRKQEHLGLLEEQVCIHPILYCTSPLASCENDLLLLGRQSAWSDHLFVQIQQLEEEKDHLASQVERLETQLANQSDQNASLRNENEELRQQLGIEVHTFPYMTICRNRQSCLHVHGKLRRLGFLVCNMQVLLEFCSLKHSAYFAG